MVDETRPDRPVVSHRVPLTRRQILAQIIVALVILGSGVGIGIGGTIFALKDRIARFPFPPREGRFDPRDPNGPVERWRSELSLTDKQAGQIRDLMAAGMTAARDRWMAMAREEQERREEFVKSMKSILTPEQFAKWQDEFRERERHFQRWRPRGPEGPGRPGRPGGPEGPGRPEGRRDHGPRGMRGPEPPPDLGAGSPPPDSPLEDPSQR